jgi:hypothetical protein
MAQATGQPRLQTGGIAFGGFTQVFDHRFCRQQFSLDIDHSLMQ